MAEITYLPLDPVKLPLVNKFYRAHGSRMRANGGQSVWVARAGLEIIAALQLSVCPPSGNAANADAAAGCWLTGMFVDPTWRRQGIAAQLVSAAVAGRDAPTWLFCKPGLSSLYRRAGFREAGVLPESLASRLVRYQRTQALQALVCNPRVSRPGNSLTYEPRSVQEGRRGGEGLVVPNRALATPPPGRSGAPEGRAAKGFGTALPAFDMEPPCPQTGALPKAFSGTRR